MSEGAVVVDFFNRAQAAQREGRWRDALALVEEGCRQKCGMCTWWMTHIYRYGYWGKIKNLNGYYAFLEQAHELGNERATLEYFRDLGMSHKLDMSTFKDPYVFGKCYLYGYLGCERDIPKAILYFEKCKDSFGKACLADCSVLEIYDSGHYFAALHNAALEGNPYDQYYFALSLDSHKRIVESIVWYRKAAEQEHVASQESLYKYFMQTCYNPVAGRYWYKRLKKHVEYPTSYMVNQDQLFDAIDKCQRACLQLILIRKYRSGSLLHIVAKDVVVMIAKMLWQTWSEDCWKVRKSRRLKEKKRIKYF
jgi:TPR repeat protein